MNYEQEENQQWYFYAVAIGRKTGIFLDRGLCHRQVNKYSGNLYQKFKEFSECIQYLQTHANLDKSDIHVYMSDTEQHIALIYFTMDMARDYWDSLSDEGHEMDGEQNAEHSEQTHLRVMKVMKWMVYRMQNTLNRRTQKP